MCHQPRLLSKWCPFSCTFDSFCTITKATGQGSKRLPESVIGTGAHDIERWSRWAQRWQRLGALRTSVCSSLTCRWSTWSLWIEVLLLRCKSLQCTWLQQTTILAQNVYKNNETISMNILALPLNFSVRRAKVNTDLGRLPCLAFLKTIRIRGCLTVHDALSFCDILKKCFAKQIVIWTEAIIKKACAAQSPWPIYAENYFDLTWIIIAFKIPLINARNVVIVTKRP